MHQLQHIHLKYSVTLHKKLQSIKTVQFTKSAWSFCYFTHTWFDFVPDDRHYENQHILVKKRLILMSYLTLNIIVTLKCGSKVTQGHWKWYHLKTLVRFPVRISEIFNVIEWSNLQ